MVSSSSPQALVEDLDEAAERYRLTFGWDTEVTGKLLQVRLGATLAAFMVSSALIAPICRYIELTGDPCVTFRLPGRDLAIAVLVDPRDVVTQLEVLPAGVAMMPMTALLSLPPSVTPEGKVHWLSRPDAKRRWLPNAATLIAAVRSLSSSTPRRTAPRVEPRDRVMMAAQDKREARMECMSKLELRERRTARP